MILEIVLILLLIFLNGFFSLSEMSIVSSRKARLKHEAEEGRKAYAKALRAAEEPGPYLSSIQVAITLIGILTGALGGATVSQGLARLLSDVPRLASIAAPLSVGIVVVLTTFLSVVLGELVPKNLALSRPEQVAAFIIKPLDIIGTVFRPLARLLSAATALVIRILGVKAAIGPDITEDEVKILIAQGAETGVFHISERDMLEGVLELDDRRITSFMTPRPEVEVVDLSDEKASIKREILANARFGYLPVVDGDLDKVVGMLPVRDSLASMVSEGGFDVKSALVAPLLIPETLSALKALALMKDGGLTTALIVDEYGGVSGLVTMSDLLGPVLDGVAHRSQDEDTPGVVRREDGSYLVDGALAISEFAEELGLDEEIFDDTSYDTVAGLVLERMGSIPKAGDRCEWDSLRFEIMDMDGNRIDKVLVERILQDDTETVDD